PDGLGRLVAARVGLGVAGGDVDAVLRIAPVPTEARVFGVCPESPLEVDSVLIGLELGAERRGIDRLPLPERERLGPEVDDAEGSRVAAGGHEPLQEYR